MQIGTLIQRRREELELSRESLAADIGVATTTVLRWEKGSLSVSFEHMVIVAKLLDKPISYFSGEEEKPKEGSLGFSVEDAIRVIKKLENLSSQSRDRVLMILDETYETEQKLKKKRNAV